MHKRFKMPVGMLPDRDENLSLEPVNQSNAVLSDRQLIAAEMLAVYGLAETYEQISERTGVSRNTLYEWRQLPEFQEEVIKRGRAALRTDLPRIYSALVGKAVSGDVKAMQLALEVSGELRKAKADQALSDWFEMLKRMGSATFIAMLCTVTPPPQGVPGMPLEVLQAAADNPSLLGLDDDYGEF